MALAFNIMQGCDPINQMCPQLEAKKTKVRLYYVAVNKAAKGVLCTVDH